MTAVLERTVARMRNADHVLVLTGAGMSAESGLPTYRGQAGLYGAGQRLDGYTIEECLSASMLRQRPQTCWKALHQLLDAAGSPRPHAGHRALAQMARALSSMTVITQNVDGLHQAAGSADVVEMHGRLEGLVCRQCDDDRAQARNTDWRAQRGVPLCVRCSGVLRPPVVLFEEALPAPALAAYEQCLRAQPDVIVVVGTSAAFPYIQAPVWELRSQGGWAVDINPEHSAVSSVVDWHWQTTAAQGLPQLGQALAASDGIGGGTD